MIRKAKPNVASKRHEPLRPGRPVTVPRVRFESAAEFRLVRVKNSHWIGAEDTKAFEAYLQSIDRGDRRAIHVARWCVISAFAVVAAAALLMNGT